MGKLRLAGNSTDAGQELATGHIHQTFAAQTRAQSDQSSWSRYDGADACGLFTQRMSLKKLEHAVGFLGIAKDQGFAFVGHVQRVQSEERACAAHFRTDG